MPEWILNELILPTYCNLLSNNYFAVKIFWTFQTKKEYITLDFELLQVIINASWFVFWITTYHNILFSLCTLGANLGEYMYTHFWLLTLTISLVFVTLYDDVTDGGLRETDWISFIVRTPVHVCITHWK